MHKINSSTRSENVMYNCHMTRMAKRACLRIVRIHDMYTGLYLLPHGSRIVIQFDIAISYLRTFALRVIVVQSIASEQAIR